MTTNDPDPRLFADPEDRSDVAKDPTDPATNAAQAATRAGVGETEWEGLTREETADLNKEAYEANQPKDDDVERILPTSLPPAPLSDPTTVSPVDPESDPGRAKAAREAAEEESDEA